MWHAPYSELVIRLTLEHGCTVLCGVKEWPSVRLILGCIVVGREWQVQGSFEARGLTRRDLARFPKLWRVKHDHPWPWHASRSQHRLSLLSFLFLTSEMNNYCVLCYHYYMGYTTSAVPNFQPTV
jgi:hypothetical protein